MRSEDLAPFNSAELVARFAKVCVAQDEALLEGKNKKFNLLFKLMMDVTNELGKRSGDQRRLLTGLFEYPNMQVRLQAAKLTRAVEPERARKQLEDIASSKWFPQAGDAGMSLELWDQGIYRPD